MPLLPAEGHNRFNPRTDNQRSCPLRRDGEPEPSGDRPDERGEGAGRGAAGAALGCTRSTVIDVTMKLTEGGLLELYAIERDGGREVHAEFHVAGGMSEQELAEATDRISHSTVE